MKIKNIFAYEILASGGYPSVECKVELEDGSVGTASVPYGASAGSHEATVLNDNDESRFKGKGMLKAAENINLKIAQIVIGKDAYAQKSIDNLMIELDGTENKSVLGGNAVLAVSLATAKASAKSRNLQLYEYIREIYGINGSVNTLPNPMMVVIEGGKHADNSTDLQEFCFSGVGKDGPWKNIERCIESYHELKNVLSENNLSTNVGNEGAFAPDGISSNTAPFEFMMQAVERAGHKLGDEVMFSIDAAASEFYRDGKYILKLEGQELSSSEISNLGAEWMEKFPIVTIEDMHHEDDWNEWVNFKKICDKHNVELVGDDLTVTNVNRLQKAIDMDAISSILIKLNQIGSLSETVETCLLAKEHGMSTVPSHRGGGETNDTSMVDLAVAVGGRFIKVGPTRGERVAKYNRLVEIERMIK